MSYHYKSPHKGIKLEDFNIGEEYAITLNIQSNDYKTIERKAYEYLRELAQLKYCDYKMYWELSALGRLHLHGYLKIPFDDEEEELKDGINNKSKLRLANFFAYDMCHLTSKFSFEIDTISDNKDDGEDHLRRPSEKTTGEDRQEDGPEKWTWKEYVEKQQPVMNVLMNEVKIPTKVTNDNVEFYINYKATPELKRFLLRAGN